MVTKKKQRYNEGGVASNTNYPFGQGQVSATQAPTGLGNNSPLVQINTPGAEVVETPEADLSLGMKKGGRVKANVKKMAFGGLGGLGRPGMGKPMTKPVIAPKPVMGKIGRPTPPPGDASNPLARNPITSKPFIPTPRVSAPTPAPNSGLVPKNDPFFESKEFKDFKAKGGPATMDMYDSPYFGIMGSGSEGSAQDKAYRKFKNISEPTPKTVDNSFMRKSDPRMRQYGTSPPSEYIPLRSGRLGVGSLIGSMKKVGAVKTQAKKMASGGVTSSASKRGDGIAQRGKTKGRMR